MQMNVGVKFQFENILCLRVLFAQLMLQYWFGRSASSSSHVGMSLL